jgi:hypothetical protein
MARKLQGMDSRSTTVSPALAGAMSTSTRVGALVLSLLVAACGGNGGDAAAGGGEGGPPGGGMPPMR